jgi:hypothetical protein
MYNSGIAKGADNKRETMNINKRLEVDDLAMGPKVL